jgi:hypothetical protein
MNPSFRTSVVVLAMAAVPQLKAQNPVRIDLVPWAQDLGPIVDVAHCGDDRLFLVRQFGQIDILVDSMTVLQRPFLDIASQVTYVGEQGLLGMAFDPDYANNGFFYLNYIDTGGDTQIARFTVSNDPDSADTASEVNPDDLCATVRQSQGWRPRFRSRWEPVHPPRRRWQRLRPARQRTEHGADPGKIARIHPEPDGTYTIPSDNPFNLAHRYPPPHLGERTCATRTVSVSID